MVRITHVSGATFEFNSVSPSVHLSQRCHHLRMRVAIQPAIPHIADHAHNQTRRLFKLRTNPMPDHDLLTDWFSPLKNSLAIASLIIATSCAELVSVSLKSRPRTIGDLESIEVSRRDRHVPRPARVGAILRGFAHDTERQSKPLPPAAAHR